MAALIRTTREAITFSLLLMLIHVNKQQHTYFTEVLYFSTNWRYVPTVIYNSNGNIELSTTLQLFESRRITILSYVHTQM